MDDRDAKIDARVEDALELGRRVDAMELTPEEVRLFATYIAGSSPEVVQSAVEFIEADRERFPAS
jgi:hypothetical protein